jgi:GNAT superfamily N-acetyltransferase
MDSIEFDPHIRPINIRHDLTAIADLIETAFAGQMDAEGRDYLHHIRQIARGIGSYLIDGNSPETSQFPFHGYLWEEDGRIIGNLTLIPVRKSRMRTYFIANVAVLPEYRGRGIARRLTDRAIAHVKAHDGKRIYLQVRHDNLTAQHIYKTTGFEEFACRTNWVLSRNGRTHPSADPTIRVTRRYKTDWTQQKDWLISLYPPEIAWNLPISLERLKPDLLGNIMSFLNGVSSRSWAARQYDRLIGLASWESGITGADYVWLATSPVWEDAALTALLPVVTARVFQPQKITINYPAGRAVETFIKCGLRELNTLIWMKKDIPGGTHLIEPATFRETERK